MREAEEEKRLLLLDSANDWAIAEEIPISVSDLKLLVCEALKKLLVYEALSYWCTRPEENPISVLGLKLLV